MKRLETICRDYLNIAEDIDFFQIVKFCKKYEGYDGDVLFLINFTEERKLIDENNIKFKDRENFKVLGFSPKPGLAKNPDHCILYCKALNSKNQWEYLRIKTNKRTTSKTWEKRRKPLKVLTYKWG